MPIQASGARKEVRGRELESALRTLSRGLGGFLKEKYEQLRAMPRESNVIETPYYSRLPRQLFKAPSGPFHSR
jgi:hypothetical protein